MNILYTSHSVHYLIKLINIISIIYNQISSSASNLFNRLKKPNPEESGSRITDYLNIVAVFGSKHSLEHLVRIHRNRGGAVEVVWL